MKKGITLQRGISLIGVIVAAGLLGILATGLNKMLSGGFQASKSISLQNDLAFVKRVLLRTNCQESLGSACTPGQLGALFQGTGASRRQIISSNATRPTKLAGWVVRARCNSQGDGFIVRAARMIGDGNLLTRDPNQFLPDPLTKQRYTWADEQTLVFGTTESLCSLEDAGGGMNIGGMYQKTDVTAGCPFYDRPNPLTGSASCPPGYNPLIVARVKQPEDGTRFGCGSHLIMCVKP